MRFLEARNRLSSWRTGRNSSLGSCGIISFDAFQPLLFPEVVETLLFPEGVKSPVFCLLSNLLGLKFSSFFELLLLARFLTLLLLARFFALGLTLLFIPPRLFTPLLRCIVSLRL